MALGMALSLHSHSLSVNKTLRIVELLRSRKLLLPFFTKNISQINSKAQILNSSNNEDSLNLVTVGSKPCRIYTVDYFLSVRKVGEMLNKPRHTSHIFSSTL